MTNEEKVKEIIKISATKQVYDIVDFKSLEEALYDDLMEMAKWKDAQCAALKRQLEIAESQRQSINSLDKLRFSLSEREKEIERLKDEHQKEMDEYRAIYFRQNKILVEQNNALKRQLAESNKQIEIYAKKVRNLEADPKESVYNDKTLITADFLIRNGFEKRQYDYLYSNEIVEITAQNIDSEAGIWRIEVAYLDDGYPQTLDICTVGQLRMFLAIQGINLNSEK